MAPANFVWRKLEWEFEQQIYRFDISRDGARGRFSSHNRAAGADHRSDAQLLEMPMAAWVALSDAVRQSSVQGRRARLPARAGKAWSESEFAKMLQAFEAGQSIGEIARLLSRTEGAIISRLAQAGLIEREAFLHPLPAATTDGGSANKPGPIAQIGAGH